MKESGVRNQVSVSSRKQGGREDRDRATAANTTARFLSDKMPQQASYIGCVRSAAALLLLLLVLLLLAGEATESRGQDRKECSQQ